MVSVFERGFKNATMKSFVIWRRYVVMQSRHNAGLRHRSEVRSLQLEIDAYSAVVRSNGAVLMRRLYYNVVKRDLALSFSTWCRNSSDVGRNRVLLNTTFRSWMRRAIRVPWKRWCEFARGEVRRRNLQPKAILALLTSTRLKLLGRAFRTLYSSIHMDHVGKHHMFHYRHNKIRNKDYFYKLMCRFAMGVDEQRLYAGWNTWCFYHEEELRAEEEREKKKAGIYRVLARLANKKAANGFHTWKLWCEVCKAKADMSRHFLLASSNTLKLYIVRLIHAALLEAFGIWKTTLQRKVKEARR